MVIGIPIIGSMESTVQKAAKALIAHYGTQKLAATAVKVEQPTISAWLNGEHGASVKSALRVEAITGGAVKASDLCPDLSGETISAA